MIVGYHLAQRGLPFVILDANERIGDAWRKRWDSLRLFTPARFNGLPGMPFPGARHSFPTKDEVADYLEAYAARFELPVRTGTRVERVSKNGHFQVSAGDRYWQAENIVVAMGTHQIPSTPPFAAELDQRIVQLDAGNYRNPDQLQAGSTLVVGAGSSGAEVALDVAPTHQTWLSGRHPGHLPFRIEKRLGRVLVPVIIGFAFHKVVTVRTPIGRKVRPKLLSEGKALIRVKPKDLAAAGIERVPRVVGVQQGLPVLEDGRVLEVSNVIWCTGFRPDFSWIDLDIFGANEVPIEPIHERGVIPSEPGLYFVGLFFLYAGSSELLRGVGRDAEYVVNHIVKHRSGKAQEPSRLLMSPRYKRSRNEAKRRAYAREARTYDQDMDFWERKLFGPEHRQWACSRAVGDTLEVAIGTGLNLPQYPLDVRLTGIDLTPEMLAVADTRAQSVGRDVDLMEADAQALPFSDASFDTVVCTYAMCSVLDEVQAIAEMKRVLRPGGRLILVDHVRSTVKSLYWLQRIYEFLPARTKGEYMTRRPALHVIAAGLHIEESDRLRGGVIERLVARKGSLSGGGLERLVRSLQAKDLSGITS